MTTITELLYAPQKIDQNQRKNQSLLETIGLNTAKSKNKKNSDNKEQNLKLNELNDNNMYITQILKYYTRNVGTIPC